MVLPRAQPKFPQSAGIFIVFDIFSKTTWYFVKTNRYLGILNLCTIPLFSTRLQSIVVWNPEVLASWCSKLRGFVKRTNTINTRHHLYFFPDDKFYRSHVKFKGILRAKSVQYAAAEIFYYTLYCTYIMWRKNVSYTNFFSSNCSLYYFKSTKEEIKKR